MSAILHVVDLTAEHRVGCAASRLAPLVGELEEYPRWLSIVSRVVPAEPDPADRGPAWWVTLTGRLGPMSRAKRLRMVCTERGGGQVCFERRELDGRRHSVWKLTARWVEESPEVTHLVMEMHYGGGLFEPLVQRLLEAEIEASRPRLDALVGR